ncbi:MAG TPA: hypothetical protein VKP59_06240, partial [Candidatus Thermoplasmatota archaeon]|nr:hypothetical protein [Candidatus Thermoplasmatota archaeon]
MNRKIFNKLNISKFMNFKNNKIIFLIIGVILVSSFIIASYMVFFTSDDESSKWLRGTVYIDGSPAPAGVNVSVIFTNKTISDVDGTNESGMYEIDVTEHVGESFELYVIYQGNMYLGSDEIGTPISMNVSEDMKDSVDVFVVTSEDNDEDDEGDDQSDDDETNDTGDDDGSSDEDETDDSDSDDDTDDDEDTGGNDDSQDNNDENDDGDTDDDEDADGDDEDDSDDDEDDEPSEDDDETDSTYLFVDKSVWQDLETEWGTSESIEIGGHVKFNITVIYNGSNLSEIQIIDTLPDGLSYDGNATVNGMINEPDTQTSNLLEWNLSAISNQNTTLYIEYDTTVEHRSTLQNNVTVNILKNESDPLTQYDEATVYVFGELTVSKSVRNINETMWNETTTVPLNGKIRFNITIEYNGTYDVENITIMDKLPNGITYLGNTTLNGEESNTESADNNKTLFWNQTILQADETLHIEFDANISKNATLKNTVQVLGNETTLGKQFDIIDLARVTGSAKELFICEKTVKRNNSWQDSIDAFVGETVTFNVTVTNLEMNVVTNLAILDTFPSGLEYVPESSVIYFENETYYKE